MHMYTATVTSQGQITIPAKLRRELDLDRAVISIIKNKWNNLEIEKVPDLLDLAGSLSNYCKAKDKGKFIDQMMKEEKKVVEKTIIDDYKESLKRMSNKLLIITPKL